MVNLHLWLPVACWTLTRRAALAHPLPLRSVGGGGRRRGCVCGRVISVPFDCWPRSFYVWRVLLFAPCAATYVCPPLSTVAGRARGSSRRHLAQVPRNREQLAMIGSAATAAARAHVRESALASSRGSCWSRSCWSWSCCCCCCSLCSIRLAGIMFQCVDASLSSGWGDFLCSVLRCARTWAWHYDSRSIAETPLRTGFAEFRWKCSRRGLEFRDATKRGCLMLLSSSTTQLLLLLTAALWYPVPEQIKSIIIEMAARSELWAAAGLV